MSYDRPHRGGGGHRRRNNREDYEDRRREVETPEERLKAAIIKLGEVDVLEEIPRVESQIRSFVPQNVTLLSEAFRLSVTEQPYKIPFYAALLRRLHDSPEGDPPIGRQILEDFWKGFQAFLDRQAWRETRLCIQFFAHCTMARLISPDSMIALLQSFTAVLDEFGVSHGRAKRAALCAGEGLMIGGPVLKSTAPSAASEIINAIQMFSDSTSSSKWVVQPVTKLAQETGLLENADELLDSLIAALQLLDASDFAQSADSFPQPYATYPELTPGAEPFSFPMVLVPPEVIELEGFSTDAGEDAQVKREEWPEYLLRLFDNDVSPNPNTPQGYAIRTALIDIIDIFDVNRKECARLLLEYPKWSLPGTFKPKPGITAELEPVPEKDWQLESTIIETLIGVYHRLPEPSQKPVYYMTLITELCKLSPSTIGPAVGKSIRKLYTALGDGLDVEVSRHFAEWFAVHMSNFGFQWVWREWVPDLALATQHPRRCFMRRAVEFEMRLAYHDRILKTLPEAMQSADAHVIAEQPSRPNFEYDDPTRPYHDAAQSVLNLFRGRAKAEDLISHLDTLRSSLEGAEDEHINVDSIVRSITMQSLLHIGSRSFSHLLNAIERYLPLLRNVASGGTSGSNEAKSDILGAVAIFWKYNRQMVGIVFDKLMQYQIVDPTDVVGWTFATGTGLGEAPHAMSLTALEWDLIKAALDKANGRVVTSRKKVTTLRKEDDDTRARAKANEANPMEVDPEGRPDEAQVENPALTVALKAYTSLTREQKAALARTLDGFISCLVPGAAVHNPHSKTVISEHAWQNRANWGSEEWNAWETWGWYKHFCRMYSPYLRNYSNTLWAVSFSKFEGSTDPAVILLKRIWNTATGQEG
ncbi:hypothetical protein BDN72DRAFT_886358 [Pluteus cervinus]|uniref:Uncharacterized protein n=1 Tax=Pluteus cervinus TaxID=181527 RepID=A0ACD3B9N3_9AGAR|nr:hypothetical protein BDN72DRAFT_886358 [Pluteus cervinus]